MSYRRERVHNAQIKIRNYGMGKGQRAEKSLWSARYAEEISDFGERRGGGARMAEIGTVMRRVGQEIMKELLPWTTKRMEERKNG